MAAEKARNAIIQDRVKDGQELTVTIFEELVQANTAAQAVLDVAVREYRRLIEDPIPPRVRRALEGLGELGGEDDKRRDYSGSEIVTDQEISIGGEFTFSRAKGLSLILHSLEHDFDLTQQCVIALRDEAIRLLKDQRRCPFHPDWRERKPKSGGLKEDDEKGTQIRKIGQEGD